MTTASQTFPDRTGSGPGVDVRPPLHMTAVDAVALSHLHADHFIDMCSFWVARTYTPQGVMRVPVYGPADLLVVEPIDP